MKANATLVKPDIKAGFWYRWTGAEWAAEKVPTSAEELVDMKISHTLQTPHAIALRSLKDKLVTPESGYRADLVDDFWLVEKLPEPTPEEVRERKAQEIRNLRDALLAKTDFYFLVDNPKQLTEEQLAEVQAYRNELRELPGQEGFPENFTWPDIPECIAKDIEKIAPRENEA